MSATANTADDDLRMAQVDYFIATDRLIQAADDAKREREKLLRLVEERSTTKAGATAASRSPRPAQNGGAQ